MQEWEAVIVRDSRLPVAYAGVAEASRRMGDDAGTAGALVRGLKAVPKSRARRLAVAVANVVGDDVVAARAVWDTLLQGHSRLPAAWIGRAAVDWELGHYREADATLLRGLGEMPGCLPLSVARARYAALRGDCRAALDRWQDVLRAEPTHHGGQAGKAQALRCLGRLNEAEAAAAEGLRAQPNHPGLLQARARVRADRGDWEGAAGDWRELTEMHPDRAGELWNYTEALRNLGRAGEADTALQRWLDQHPDNPARLAASPKQGFGQLGQDLWVLRRTGFKYGGFFVDVGASDGVLMSNTFLLEKTYRWRGICLEPNRDTFPRLVRNRDCTCRPECAYSESDKVLPFVPAGPFGSLEEFADSDSHGPLRGPARPRTHDVCTISLNDLLEQEDAPRDIEYVSIDVEGAEYEVLRAFDFDRWRVRHWTVEHNFADSRGKVARLMRSRGYTRMRKHIEDWYFLPGDAPPEQRGDDAGRAHRRDLEGRFRELMSDPNNALIPRVETAGEIIDGAVVMHNGLMVLLGEDAYYNDFADILTLNRGVHEPQEERVFMEILNTMPANAVMVELGSYWAFYSMWFNRDVPGAINYMIEPDPERLATGERNFALNGRCGRFVNARIGGGEFRVHEFMRDEGIPFVHILHADIQGAELEMLRDSEEALLEKSVGYFFISTHKQRLHLECREYLEDRGYAIVAAADVDHETYCRDGILVARSSSVNGPAPMDIGSRSEGRPLAGA